VYDFKSQLALRAYEYFLEIMKIPRGSGNEDGIADWLCEFAAENGIECARDEFNNVFMIRPGEGEAVLLQSHSDMVCEKNRGTEHDFERDPIEPVFDGEYLTARGTTLGADDGVGMAMSLAALTSGDIKRPLEALFTSDEEVGMIGANNFDYSRIKARKLVNLDSETDGEAVISCAGGVRDTFSLDYDVMPTAGKLLRINVGGLLGGHSGTEINAGRVNAIRLMGRTLAMLYADTPFNLISLTGGMKSNAIPRECEAVIAVCDIARAADITASLECAVRSELKGLEEEKKLSLRCAKVKASEAEKYPEMLTLHDTSRLISLLTLAPCGVINERGGFVITSTNIGVIAQDTAARRIDALFESRSSVSSELDELIMRLDRLSHVLEIGVSHSSRYPGWQLERDTPLQKAYIKACAEVYPEGFVSAMSALHAGLECGLIKGRIPDMDMISIGATVTGGHTPDETLSLSSLDTTAHVLRQLLI